MIILYIIIALITMLVLAYFTGAGVIPEWEFPWGAQIGCAIIWPLFLPLMVLFFLYGFVADLGQNSQNRKNK